MVQHKDTDDFAWAAHAPAWRPNSLEIPAGCTARGKACHIRPQSPPIFASLTRIGIAAGLVLGLAASIGRCGESQELQDVISQMRPYAGAHHPGVDTTSLTGKVMCGYQGWFAAVGDGSGRGWIHYGRGSEFGPGYCTIDLWPDMHETEPDERYPTPFKQRDGEAADVFSSYNPKTVLRHFQWMKEHGIDGVFLQRFGADLRQPKDYHHRNVVTANVQAGANRSGRTWAMMYDLSGLGPGEIETIVMEDWKRLVNRMNITADRSYLHHEGKPLVAVWGVGFSDGRGYTLAECEELVRFLKSDPKYGGNTVMVGVPTYWRTLDRDAVRERALHRIISLADIVSPWTVGRYNSPEQARQHAKSVVKPDIEWAQRKSLDYLPVVFPGFSWQNLQKVQGCEAKLGQIPRLGGEFLWSQAAAFKDAGARMLYVAMFDELDEGTAIFKCTNDPPVGESRFLTFEGLASDHYLWLTGEIAGALRAKGKTKWELPVRDAEKRAASNGTTAAHDP
jgi:hypothetical protein